MECSWCLSPKEGMWKTDIIKYQNTLTILSRESTAYTTETQVLSPVLPQKHQQRKENDIIFPLQLQVPLTQFEVHANLILQSFLKNKKFWHPWISSHSWWRWVSNGKTSKVGRQRNSFYNVTLGRQIWAAEGTPLPFVGTEEKQEHKREQVLWCRVITDRARVLHPATGKRHPNHLPPPAHKFFCASGMIVRSWSQESTTLSQKSESHLDGKRDRGNTSHNAYYSKQSKMHYKDPNEILGKGILKILTHKRYVKLEFIVFIVCPFWIISSQVLEHLQGFQR